MKAVVFTLGCKVNGCESASLMRGLEERGWQVSDQLEPADLFILNTCAVTGEAEKKSRQAVARIRAVAPDARIIVCGCAAQAHPESFAEKENVALVCGAQGKRSILGMLDGEGVNLCGDGRIFDELPAPHFLRARAYVKIQDGCDRFCSYCIIPYLRGRSRSRGMESALKEIRSSESEEIVITGIDISSYRTEEGDLADLLGNLRDFPGRIRLGSLEVHAVTRRLLEAAAGMPDFAPHFHLSLQSGSDAVLRKMNRRYTAAQYGDCVRLIREYFPEAAVTTDIIAGFPAETEEDFEETLAFMREIGFSQCHCFAYSRREGTRAAGWKEVSPEEKSRRLHLLLAEAEKLRSEYEAGFAGRDLSVVPEEEKDGMTAGYSGNYIRLYVPGTVPAKETVRAVRPFRDGLLCERIQQQTGGVQ